MCKGDVTTNHCSGVDNLRRAREPDETERENRNNAKTYNNVSTIDRFDCWIILEAVD